MPELSPAQLVALAVLVPVLLVILVALSFRDSNESNPPSTDVEIGDEVQPTGIELEEPYAWEVVDFVQHGQNPKYKIVIEHPTSGARLTLDNLSHNTKTTRGDG